MNIDSIKQVLNYMLDNNEQLTKESKDKITIEIQGHAGAGKTSIIEQVAKERGMRFVKLSLSQIEEAGDMCGIPIKQYCMYSPEGKEIWVAEKVIDQYINLGYTLCPDCEPKMSYAIPDWVPTDPEERVLCLLDDYTRANQVILQATMELISKGEYISWKLPKNTYLVLSSNPCNDEYFTNELDAAMKSRYMSFNLEFDIKPWAIWAEKENLPSAFINFALFNPEIFERSKQINARSYSLFANACSSIKDVSSRESMNLINLLSKGSFGEDGDYIGGLFIQFINNKLDKLMSAEQLLSGEWKSKREELRKQVYTGENYRADIASVLTTRLINYIQTKPTIKVENIVNRILEIIEDSEILLTEDLLLSLISKLNKKYPQKCRKFLLNPKVQAKLLQ